MVPKKETPHPRFDRIAIEVLYDPTRDGESQAVQVLTNQGKQVLEIMAEAAHREHNSCFSGRRLREVLEMARNSHFYGTKQKEIFRIFQDHRARFERAGFIRLLTPIR